jgi:hypothetical protein
VIEPEKNSLGREAAEYLLTITFPESDLDRMNELAGKARAGTLNEVEREELAGYNHVSHLVALMHSKARKSLG